jgi:hypothetical protein
VAAAGKSGLGGLGGAWKTGDPTVGLNNVDAVDPDAADWTGGAGGHGKGGGGGGYGGGGGGKGCDNQGSSGGGGGGSWKQVAALTDPDAPTDSKQSPNTSQQVVLTFNL